jgi:DNA-binding transcriptional LysR family regulator
MNEIRAISVFIQAATLGNLRKAAVAQGISPQAASQAVMQLEKTLGIRLFHRTTRKLSLTEEGGRFFEAVKPGISILNNAFDDARRAREEVSGVLRISAPKTLSAMLWPCFAEFCAAYPQVRLDIQFDDRFTDLASDRTDVGFRGGSSPSAGMIARFLLPIQLIVCASPAYIEQHGAPQTIDALQDHRCSGYRQANTGQQAPWEFKVGNEKIYRDFAPVVCSNDMDTEVQAVLSGLMVGQLASFAATQLIRSGRLVPLLLQHVTELDGIYLYYGRRTQLPLRVRTFIDFVVERMTNNSAFYLQPEELQAEYL